MTYSPKDETLLESQRKVVMNDGWPNKWREGKYPLMVVDVSSVNKQVAFEQGRPTVIEECGIKLTCDLH